MCIINLTWVITFIISEHQFDAHLICRGQGLFQLSVIFHNSLLGHNSKNISFFILFIIYRLMRNLTFIIFKRISPIGGANLLRIWEQFHAFDFNSRIENVWQWLHFIMSVLFFPVPTRLTIFAHLKTDLNWICLLGYEEESSVWYLQVWIPDFFWVGFILPMLGKLFPP